MPGQSAQTPLEVGLRVMIRIIAKRFFNLLKTDSHRLLEPQSHLNHEGAEQKSPDGKANSKHASSQRLQNSNAKKRLKVSDGSAYVIDDGSKEVWKFLYDIQQSYSEMYLNKLIDYGLDSLDELRALKNDLSLNEVKMQDILVKECKVKQAHARRIAKKIYNIT